ncbi:Mitogen-activated protein kinase kinase kinase 3 [Diplonema papillatum]|nr:Mitogen-activated protein kinase kinase kinase 3 [Diplonema papillatum]
MGGCCSAGADVPKKPPLTRPAGQKPGEHEPCKPPLAAGGVPATISEEQAKAIAAHLNARRKFSRHPPEDDFCVYPQHSRQFLGEESEAQNPTFPTEPQHHALANGNSLTSSKTDDPAIPPADNNGQSYHKAHLPNSIPLDQPPDSSTHLDNDPDPNKTNNAPINHSRRRPAPIQHPDEAGPRTASPEGAGHSSFATAVAIGSASTQSGQHVNSPPAPAKRGSAKHPPMPKLNWKKGDMIGRGTFGAVYMGLDLDTGRHIAVKEMDFPPDLESDATAMRLLRNVHRELTFLRTLSHVNIVQYLGMERRELTVCIFMEYIPGGSILSLIKKFGRIPEPLAQKYTSQILSGLNLLHAKGVVHRDIKGANVLVTTDGIVKLADFGNARQLHDNSIAISLGGSPYWMAPEVIQMTGHSTPADVWSVGATITEMVTGRPPWSEYPPVPALYQIGHTDKEVSLPEGNEYTPELLDLLSRCFQRDPSKRPTVPKLLQHVWLTQSKTPATPENLMARKIERGTLNMAQAMQPAISGLRVSSPRPATADAGSSAKSPEDPSNGSPVQASTPTLITRRSQQLHSPVNTAGGSRKSHESGDVSVGCLVALAKQKAGPSWQPFQNERYNSMHSCESE